MTGHRHLPEPQDRGHHAALSSATRRSILAALATERAPRDAATLAHDLGLHVTTVRFHLGQLEDAGLVRSEQAETGRRGRPRLLYAATGDEDRDERARSQLIETLAGALAQGEGDGGRHRSIEAGRRWADEIGTVLPELERGSDALLDVLSELGFEPARDEDGIELRACPFRAAARKNPGVVCGVHEGLVRRITERTAPPGEPTPTLLPFVAPTRCRVAYR